MNRDIARELFRSYRGHRKKNMADESERVKSDEPTQLNSILNELVEARSWRQGIAEGNLFSEWSKIVGNEIANHCEPITLFEGKLTIKAESTAWATQLRLMDESLLKTIQQSSPGAVVENLQIIGPTAPSWRRGLRTIRGARGPRDTYG